MRKVIQHLVLPPLFLLFLSGSPSLYGGSLRIHKVEPPHWWVGMKWNRVQLMVYGDSLNDVSAKFNSSSLKVVAVGRIANPSYTFVDVEIDNRTLPGDYTLMLNKGGDTATVSFPVLARASPVGRHQGFNPSDVIYLITPDRFCNGDVRNDSVPGMLEGAEQRNPIGRHGGDIQGIINKLDYLKDLGITAIWVNPLTENRGRMSYHGYAVTDLYRIDPRFGTNGLYARLVDEAHRRGLKIIMDHVNNHFGIMHSWVQNLPVPDWLNGTTAQHQRGYHGKIELHDIHSDSVTKSRATRGWFSDYMPDLNQRNPFVKNYLIQNTIWWIESTGLDGIREDTYPYVEQYYAADWCTALINEYPQFNIVGEVWVGDPVYLAPYQKGSALDRDLDPKLPSVTDFALHDALTRVFKDNASIKTVYETLTQDFLYTDPYGLVTFLDNHDIERIMFKTGGNVPRFKMALQLLMTTRGIPQILYGTELGMLGGSDHGALRADFPGGFPWHSRDAFTPAGRTKEENDIFEFMKGLLRLRRQHGALAQGNLVHFSPKGEVYVYFRIAKDEKLLIVVNNNPAARGVSLEPYRSQLQFAISLNDLKSGKEIGITPASDLTVGGYDVGIYRVLERRP